jgi:precorrin-6Y C5,15-methyltransferase (decarboxylating)
MNPIKTIDRPLQPLSKTKTVTVVGMSDCGCGSLTAQAVNAVSRAQALVGGERHLAFFPQFEGVKLPVKGNITEVIKQVEELSQENHVVVLSSGDPMYFGIGGLLVKKLGLDNVDIVAHPGSVQLAFSKIGMNWDDALTLSLHGRPRKGFITRIQTRHKIAVFTDAENSPQSIAGYMLSFGENNWKAWVCEHLGGPEERVRTFSIEELSKTEGISGLNILILIRDHHRARARPVIAFLHEDEFEKRVPKKGLITKREARLLSLGFMSLKKDSVVWDIGAASGSVSIEAAKLCTEGTVYAVEVDHESVQICKENLITHKLDNVEVIEGRAPEALRGLPNPDAVFVGGSKGSMREILEFCLKQLNTDGRLVVNAVTFENVQETYQYFKEMDLDPEVVLLSVSRGVPLASYHRYEALNPIHIFAVRKSDHGRPA